MTQIVPGMVIRNADGSTGLVQSVCDCGPADSVGYRHVRVEVEIMDGKGHHKKGDRCVWRHKVYGPAD